MSTSLFRPDQYSAEEVVSTTDAAGVIGKIGFDFGFRAGSVAVWNDKATAIYLSLDSTTGSTGGFKLKAGESVAFNVFTGMAAFASTTTSTGDFVRLLALRG